MCKLSPLVTGQLSSRSSKPRYLRAPAILPRPVASNENIPRNLRRCLAGIPGHLPWLDNMQCHFRRVNLCIGLQGFANCRIAGCAAKYLDTRENTPVRIVFDTSSSRYQLNTSVGAQEWANLMPSGGHLIRLQESDATQTYSLALFHQLRCLDILREDYASGKPSPLRKHCLNYIRQSVLCIADTHLEYSKAGL